MSDENTHAVADSGRVRPRETTNEPQSQSKKAKKIKIGGKTEYPYSTEAVMAGSRGNEKSEQHGELPYKDSVAVESMKKEKYSNTPPSGALGR